MEDDCWSIKALRVVNCLTAYIALKEGFKERSKGRGGCRVSKTERTQPMKLTTIALAIAFALPSTFALARGGISVGSHAARPFGGATVGAAGRGATRARDVDGAT